MPPVIPDAPWWANISLIVLSILTAALTAVFVAWIPHRSTKKRLESIATDAAATRQQAENSHGTNLRDDIDETRCLAEAAASGVRRVEGYLTDLDKTIQSLERSLDRRDRLQTNALEGAIEERDSIISEAIRDGQRRVLDLVERSRVAHVEECPVRQQWSQAQGEKK